MYLPVPFLCNASLVQWLSTSTFSRSVQPGIAAIRPTRASRTRKLAYTGSASAADTDTDTDTDTDVSDRRLKFSTSATRTESDYL